MCRSVGIFDEAAGTPPPLTHTHRHTHTHAHTLLFAFDLCSLREGSASTQPAVGTERQRAQLHANCARGLP